MSTSAAQPYQPQFHLTGRQLAGALIGLVLTLFLVALDQTIVGTALPRIIMQLNGFDRYPWVTTAYLLTSTIAVPIFAKLSDMYGRKGFLLWGNVLFVLASALCGAAGQIPFFPGDGMTQLITFRGIQGIGAGMAVALMFTIIGDMFAPAERAKYQGLFAAVYGLASMIGPTIGGWITDQLSWRWAFYVNLPVGAVAAAAIFLELPNFKPHGVRRIIDWWGLITLIACLIPLLLALSWVTGYGWSSPRVAGLLSFALVMLGAFLFCEQRAEEPFLPLNLFREPIFVVSSIAVFMLGLGTFGVILYVPLFMQGVLGVSATRSGSLLTPLLIAAVVGSMATGQAISKTGRYRSFAIAGAILATVGMFLMAIMDKTTTNAQVVRNMIIAGIGMGIMQPIYTLVVQNVAPATQRGAATASTQFFRAIGSTVGVAVFGSVLLTLFHHDFQQNIPPNTPARALAPFNNPLLVVQYRDRLEAAFGQYPGGTALLHRLFDNVRNALVHGIHAIFVVGAVLMASVVVVNFFLREIPLQKRAAAPAQPPTNQESEVEPSTAV
ncbi:MAG TPA: MDR family MFS transporter [Candidatus Angelobacter sp.]|jgi:EmrB/QacA subfamily drug resistance transporter|nr:MDR family MFS transporter [Candidatus Angelobacter sp.]